MTRSRFPLAVCQLRTETDYDVTMEKTAAMIHEAAVSGASVVVLPEMFSCPYSREYFHAAAKRGHSDVCRQLAGFARDNRVILVGGSWPSALMCAFRNSSAPWRGAVPNSSASRRSST